MNSQDPCFVKEEIPLRADLVHRFKIDTVIGRTWMIKNSELSSRGFKSHLLKYDSCGNKVNQQKYDRDGKVIYAWMYAKGLPVKEVSYESSGRINYTFEFVYNNSKNWKEKRLYLSSGLFHYCIVPHRDVLERIVTATYYDSSSREIQKDSYFYDNFGRLIRMKVGQMGEWVFEYATDNNLKKRTGNLSGASIFGENFEFQYDDRGLLVRINHLHHDTTVLEYSLRDS
jgi:hypothetical protein